MACGPIVKPGDEAEQEETPAALAGATGAKDEVQLWLDNSLRDLARQAFVRAVAALDPDERPIILETAVEFYSAGQPVPPFAGIMAEADHWADWASPAELKAYTLAAYTRMPPSDQRAFLAFVQKEAA